MCMFIRVCVLFQPQFYVEKTNSTVRGYKYITVYKSRDYQGLRVSYDNEDGVIKVSNWI